MTKVINSPEELREALMDYVGTAYFTLGRPVIAEYLSRIPNANTNELIQIAKELGLIAED